MPTSSRSFDMRLVAYVPLGARIGPVPDLGFTISDTAAGPTLSATISSVIAGSLPTYLEVAVEWWHASTKTWTEGRDSRFAITQTTADDRDKVGTVTWVGLGIGAYLLAAALLKGVDPFVNTTGTTEAVRTNATVSVSGTTFTWVSHVLFNGDRVRINAKGNAKSINGGSVYYVINATTNTFQLARGATSSTAINAGTASNVSMTRIVTRILFTGTNGFSKSDSVSVVGGGAIGLTDGSQYFVVGVTSNSIQLASQRGGVPIEFTAGATNVAQVYRYLDGQRVFTNATPGTVMDAVFLEARGRGWGVNPTDSSQMMLHGWTTGADSTGAAWTRMADDPDTPGTSIAFQPGTPGTQVLQALLDNQYAEWWTTGRVIQLVNYGTGNDHSADTSPMRIGTTASSVKVEADLTGLRNAFTVRGTGPILVQQDGTPAAGSWGRLETYETASGATSKTLATKQAKTDLAANSAPAIGYTVTEVAQEATWLPLVSYQRCDWVAVQLSGTGWTRLRCIGWSFTKAPAGGITVTTNLERIKRTLLTKVAKATVVTSSGLSTTGSPGSTLQESDNRVPSAPLGVAVTSLGTFSNDGKALATATVTWLPVVTDINGGDVQATEYDVWVRAEGDQYGHSVGRTAGLSLDVPALASGSFFEVSIRALSSTGTWGEFSPELEFQAAFNQAIPAAPTAPTVTGNLGSVRITWDGNLTDPVSGTTAPPAGFAYVYAVYATSSALIAAGSGTPIGTNMGNAGTAIAGGLTVGSTYWFGLYAVNTLGASSPVSAATSFTVAGVTGPDLLANSVTANQMAAGSITADKLDAGTVPQGSPSNRVPQPPFLTAFWSKVVAGTTPGFRYGSGTGASSTTSGLVLAAGASGQRVSLTQLKQAAPASGKLSLNVAGSIPSSCSVYVTGYTSAGTSLGDVVVPASGIYTLPATAALYDVFVANFNTTTTATISTAQVFEVIGGTGTQAAELSPSGLRLYQGDSTGAPTVSLTTSSDDVLSLSNALGDQVASIDNLGNAGFTTVTAGDGSAFDGVELTLDAADPDYAFTLPQSSPNGNGWTRGDVSLPDGSSGQVALLDRLARGVIYDVTWPSQNGISVNTQFRRIAQDKFTLEDGRSYQFVVQDGGLWVTNNASGFNVYLELQLNTSPNPDVPTGTVVQRAVVANGDKGYYALPPVIFAASANQATIDTANRVLPANVPLYWQLNFNLSGTPTSAYPVAEFGNTRGLTVVDLGSAYPTRPNNGADSLADVHDYSSTGSSSGSTSSGTTATSKTVQAAASWSTSWNGGGSTKVTGSGQYTNAHALYQGNGSSAMGSEFGFSSSFLSQFAGKTVTSAYVYIKNAYQAYSGKSALVSTHGDSSAPATISGRGSNQFSKAFSAGQGQWIALNSAVRAGLSSGSVKGFRLGVDGSDTNYGYWEGVGYGSHPPQLKVTFH